MNNDDREENGRKLGCENRAKKANDKVVCRLSVPFGLLQRHDDSWV